jgi:runt-related transcription factor 1
MTTPKGPEDEWKNIHVMLNCILQMVEKTKRALSILQNRTFHNEVESSGTSSASASATTSWLRRPNYAAMDSSEDFKRQAGEMMAQALRSTEDRVAEVKRRAGKSMRFKNSHFTCFLH